MMDWTLYSNPVGREVIRDAEGRVIRTSQNLAGVRRYAGRVAIDRIEIAKLPCIGARSGSPFGPKDNGQLRVFFADGASFGTCFSSYDVLRDWLTRWRNVYGAPLFVEGRPAGKIGPRTPALIEP